MDNVEYALRIILRARDEMAGVLARARTEVRGFANDSKGMSNAINTLNQKIATLHTQLDKVEDRLRKHTGSTNKSAVASGKLATAEEQVARATQATAGAIRNATGATDDHTRSHDRLASSTRRSSSEMSGFIGVLERFSKESNNSHDSIASLDNRLRGMGLLLALAWSQQLISGLAALGGEFTAVGGSAVFAGGAIGGSFVAGIAQSLPAIGLLVAALARVKAVMDVVQQSNEVQKQQYHQQQQEGQKVAAATDQIANANDSLASANDGLAQAHKRVADAQENLNRVREQAGREIDDLILKEKEAALAARGAALSQEEAQAALRQAIAGGRVDEIQRAELGIQDANVRRSRAELDLRNARVEANRARSQGVGGLDDVRQAESQLQDAKNGVEQAEKAIDRANRGLKSARTSAKQATADTFAAADALDYMLKQLSPAERRMYDSIQRIQTTYKKNFRPITDIIVNSFTRGIDQGNKMLKDKRILNSASLMATGVAKQFDKIRTYFSQDRFIRQFLRIMDQARANLDPIGDIVQNIAETFANVAEAAGPAFHELVGYVKDLSDRLLNLSRDDGLEDFFLQGEKHVEAWGDAIQAALKLLATLASLAQGDGLKSVNDLTAELDKGTAWLRDPDNADQIAKFFKQSREAAYEILSVLWTLGKAMLSVFNADSVENLGEVLKNVVIPALAGAVKVMGLLTQTFAWFINLSPLISSFAKLGLTLLLFTKLANSTRTMLKSLAGEFVAFKRSLDTGRGSISTLFDVGLKQGGKFLTMLGNIIKQKTPLKGLGGSLENFGTNLQNRRPGTGVEPTVPVGTRGTTVAPVGTGRGGRTTPAPIPRTEPTRGAPTVVTGTPSRGPRPVAGPGQRPVEPTIAESAERSATRGRVLRGVGIAGAAAAAVAVGSRNSGRSLESAQDLSSLGAALDNFGDILGSIASLDFSGLLDVFGTDKGDLENLKSFSKDFATNMGQLTRDRDAEGLRDLSDNADKLAKSFPRYADALHEAAQQAEQQAQAVDRQNTALKSTADVARSLSRKGVTIDVDVRAKTAKVTLEDLNFYLGRLRQGIPTTLKGLTDEVQAEVERINQVFVQNGERTPDWYKAMAQTYQAAINNVKRLQSEGKISAKEAGKQIDELRDKMRLFTAGNAWGGAFKIGKDFAREVAQGKGDRQKAIDSIVNQLGDLPPAARRNAAEMAVGMVKKMEASRPELKGVAKRLTSDIGARFRDMRDINIKRSQQMAGGIGATLSNLGGDIIPQGLKGIESGLNSALDALGLKKVKFSLSGVGKFFGNIADTVKGFFGGDEHDAVGGWVGRAGNRGRDAVRTVLGKGEAVLNWAHQPYVDAALHEKFGFGLGGLFDRVRGYHAGGPGQGGYAAGGYALGDVHPGVRRLAEALLGRFPGLSVTSTTGGTHAANSYHYRGLAVDIGGAQELMDRAAGWLANSDVVSQLTEGIHNPNLSVKDGAKVPSSFWGAETWAGHINHIHIAVAGMIDKITGGVTDAVKKIKVPQIEGPDGALKTIAQAALSRVARQANKLLDRKAASTNAEYDGPSGAGQAAPPGTVRNWLTKALRLTGQFSSANLNALYARTMQESGGNPRAINLWDSNAAAGHPSKGLIQTIDSTFAQYRLRSLPNDIWNPVANAAAAIRYMLARYGHIVGASNTGYRFGGPIPGYGGGDKHSIRVEGGEHVWTKEEVQAAGGHGVMRLLRRLVGGGTQGGPSAYAQGGQVFYVGDSLGVGTSGPLDQILKNVRSDTKVGRTSDQALEILKKKLTDVYKSVVFDVGTNDASAQALSKSLKKALRLVGDDRSLTVATVRGPGAAAKNRVIRQFANAHDNVNLVDWASGSDDLVGSDGIHASVAGYRKRAQEFAQVIKKGGADLTEEGKRTQQIMQGIYTLPTLAPRTWQQLLNEVKKFNKAFASIPKKALATTDAVFKTVAQLTTEGGILDTMQSVIDRFTTRASNAVARLGFTQGGPGQNLTQSGAQQDMIRQQILNSDKVRQRLGVMYNTAAKGLGDVESVLGPVNAQIKSLEKDGKISSKEQKRYDALIKQRNQLQGVRVSLIDKMDDADSKILAEQQNRLELQQNLINQQVTDALRPGNRAQAGYNFIGRLANVAGNTGLSIDMQRRTAASQSAQAEALRPLIQQAQQQGFTDLADQLSDQAADLYASAQEGAKAAFQAESDDIARSTSRKFAKLDTDQRIATAIGDNDWLSRINNDRLAALKAQKDDLVARAKAASDAGYTDLAQDLSDQVDDVNASIAEQIHNNLQSVVDSINNDASRQTAHLDRFSRMLDAVGAVGLGQSINFNGQTLNREGVMRARGAAMQNQLSGLQGALAQAQDQGDLGMIRDLTDQIEELQVAIAENTRAIFQARIDDVNAKYDRQGQFYDRFSRMIDAMGAVGLAQVVQFAGQAMSRSDIFTARGVSLEQQRRELQGLLGEAQGMGDMQFVQDLTDQLAELDITIQENTKALFDARVSDVNNTADYNTSVIDLQKQIIELTDQLEGTNSNTALAELTRQRGDVLQTQRAGLQQLLDEAVAAGNQQEIQDLTKALLENQVAILQNSQTLKELNGQLNWQTFTSIGWRTFREAIFTGMGALMPQYEIPGAATGAIVGRTGAMLVHEGEEIRPASVARRPDFNSTPTTTIDYDLNVNMVREKADPVEISQKTMFELSRLSR